MSLKFSDIVPRLTRGEMQRTKEGASAPAPPTAIGDADTGRRFDLGEDAAQFAEDLLERAIGAQVQGAPHAEAEPAAESARPAAEAAILASFGFEFDDDAPPSRLAIAVSSVLSDDDGEDLGPSWLDQPAGPDAPADAPIPTHATETVTRRDTPLPPEPPRPAASAQDIAHELMRAVDPGDTPPGGVPSEELERLLSGALEEGGAATAPGAGDEPALDPSHVAPGDFRSLAAGLIAELEASLNHPPERAPEDSP